MTRIYQSMWRSTAKAEAQDQLSGRTHYVDDSSLRFHHSRIISCDTAAGGLLFWLIESVSSDMNNTQRGFRYVVFDVFGNVVSNVSLDECVTTSKAANKACREFLAGVDAIKVTKEGIKRHKKQNGRDLDYLKEQIKNIKVA